MDERSEAVMCVSVGVSGVRWGWGGAGWGVSCFGFAGNGGGECRGDVAVWPICCASGARRQRGGHICCCSDSYVWVIGCAGVLGSLLGDNELSASGIELWEWVVGKDDGGMGEGDS